MTKEQVLEKIQEILDNKIGIEREDCTLDATFKNDFGMDSLDIVEFVMEVEKEFNIAIDDMEMEDCHTVSKVVDMVHKLVS